MIYCKIMIIHIPHIFHNKDPIMIHYWLVVWNHGFFNDFPGEALESDVMWAHEYPRCTPQVDPALLMTLKDYLRGLVNIQNNDGKTS